MNKRIRWSTETDVLHMLESNECVYVFSGRGGGGMRNSNATQVSMHAGFASTLSSGVYIQQNIFLSDSIDLRGAGEVGGGGGGLV